MKIQHWVTEHPATVDASDTLKQAVGVMNQLKIGAVLVTDAGKLVGIFSERDLIRLAAGPDGVDETAPMSRIMTRRPITAQASDDYNVVYMLMKINNIRHIPILDGEALVGIVSIRDLTHFYQNKLESEYSEAREMIDSLKQLVHLSTDEVLDTLFSEINHYKELSLTDHLTGLYNKRYFMRRLQEEAARAVRYRQELSIIFCDIDHFKKINDNYGHHAGDEVLKQVGTLLAGGMGDLKVVSRLRKSDIIARYGGEEFVVILPETAPENAVVAAGKMRTTIEQRPFQFNGTTVTVTMSFGVAGICDAVKAPEDLISRADAAMYRAKQNGRNRVELYNDETDSGLKQNM
jgi:diguanylate cyclase (GGDEF)-like protein